MNTGWCFPTTYSAYYLLLLIYIVKKYYILPRSVLSIALLSIILRIVFIIVLSIRSEV